jgi:ribosome-associated toxin RatA of RatAB toxin-antitoxin module
MRVERTLLMPHPIETVFDIIEQAEHYPRFIPWCTKAVILERDDTMVWAILTMRVAGLNLALETRNPKRRPEWLQLKMVRGPLRRFEGEWRLTALNATACRIGFTLEYDITDPVVSRLAGPVFARMADTLVDAYVARAEYLHAHPDPARVAAAPPVPVAAAPDPVAAVAPTTAAAAPSPATTPPAADAAPAGDPPAAPPAAPLSTDSEPPR